MLTQTSRYVLSVLCHLARHRTHRVPAREIAAATGTPPNYVGKILGVLRKRGVVTAQKGWGGGFALDPQAGDLSLGELLGYFGERPEPVECPFVEPQCGCPLARRHQPSAMAGGVAAGARPPSGPSAERSADPVVCPYGAADCLVAAPCPLHAHWAKVREGSWGLAGTTVSEMVQGGAG